MYILGPMIASFGLPLARIVGHCIWPIDATRAGARVLTSRGQPAVIEREQLLTFRLEEATAILARIDHR